jgi:DNA-binding winged helix-turn-helix (wHTH) protein
MTAQRSVAAQRPETIAFSSFRLDLRASQLTCSGAPIALRPKTWAVLVHLAERPGALVTKEELLDAVWPDVAVTPDTLTKSIGELRLALGDDYSSPGFIATVHRRGFRFIAKLDDAPTSSDEAVTWQAGDAGVRPFVGRDAELRSLAERFDLARRGERQMVFLTGPAGVGKTRLVETFLDRPALHSANPPVWIARGTCVEQHGPGEPYLPVLKAIERLAHRTDADRLTTLLRRTAPTWLAQMPWLLADDAEALRQSLQAARAERMLREFAALIEALTADLTLVLVLEDLHWCDPATVDLLTLLGERRELARLLVIGSYRPAELAVHEHVLANAVRGMQLHRQCSELPVHEFSESSVRDYLEARFPGAELPAPLAQRVHAHTDGNPLFVTAVVDHMLAQGWILETAPGWSFVAAATQTSDLGLPDDARRMIAAQLDGLSPADRSLLDAASVAGLEFVAQTVATALRADLDDVEARCETLARPQRFLRFAGSGDWADGGAALQYALVHELFRRSVYEAIPAGRKQRLHQRVGEALESAYGARASEIAAELAAHFQAGGDYPRALTYLAAAAARARQRFAGREAIGYLTAAIALAERMPAGVARQRCELEIRLALAPTLAELRGFAANETVANCERAYELCREVGTPQQQFEVLYALVYAYAIRADAARTPTLIQELNDVADRLGTAKHRMLAQSIIARSTVLTGDFADVRRIIEGPLAEFARSVPEGGASGYGADPVIGINCTYALTLWFLGSADRAAAVIRKAVGDASRPGISPFTQVAAIGHAAMIAMFSRDYEKMERLSEQILAFTLQHELPYWNAMGGALHGWAAVQRGEIEPGLAELTAARDALAATGARIFSTYILFFLAEAYRRENRFDSALASVQEGLRIAELARDCTWEPELWRCKGELLIAQSLAGAPDSRGDDLGGSAAGATPWREAQQYFQQAIATARRLGAKPLELRAAISLARARHTRGNHKDAVAELEPICAAFATDDARPELLEARALLAQLTAQRPRRQSPNRSSN